MLKWIENHKILSIGIILLTSLLLVAGVPLLLSTKYLEYYGAVLTFIGTTILGIVTVWQNHISQLKSEEINKLNLALQTKSTEMAEQSYLLTKLNDELKNTPKFELHSFGIGGGYGNASLILKNVSEIIVSGIKSISFEVISETNEVISTSDKVQITTKSLTPSEETRIAFNNDALKIEYEQRGIESIKSFTMVWKFQCEATIGKVHHFMATLFVENPRAFCNDWKVERIC